MTNPTFPKRIRKADWIEEFVPKAGDGLCPGFWKGAPGAFGCPYRCNYCFLTRNRRCHDALALKHGETCHCGGHMSGLTDDEPNELWFICDDCEHHRIYGKGCVLYPLAFFATEGEDEIGNANDGQLFHELVVAQSEGVKFINWGESADSLAMNAETKFLQHLFRDYQELGERFPTALLLTKSSGDGWLDWVLDQEPTDKIVFAFSVTMHEVALCYERGTASINRRLATARQLSRNGWRVRLRLDPLMVIPEPDAEDDLALAIEELGVVFGHMRGNKVEPWLPELITLGTLRFNTPHPLVREFNMQRDEGGRWRLPFEQRVELYKAAVEAVDRRVPLALCKETPDVHEAIFGKVPKPEDIRCNCTP